MKPHVIIGAGGLALEVHALLQQSYSPLVHVVSDPRSLDKYSKKELVVGDLSWLSCNKFVSWIIAIGDPTSRRKVAEELEQLGLGDQCGRYSFGYQYTRLALGCFVCPGAAIGVEVEMGKHVYINFNAVVGHGAKIGSYSSLNPNVTIGGDTKLGEGVLVGGNAFIKQRLEIGPGATIGAGAVVTRDVPAGVTVVGVPAREMARK